MRRVRDFLVLWSGCLLGMTALLCGGSAASAANVTWTGATSNDFNDASNWGGVTPAGNTAVFYQSGAANFSNIDVSADVSLAGLTLNSSAAGPIAIGSLGGHAIIIAGNLTTDAAAGPLTINSNLVVQRTATENWTINGASSVTINGIISSLFAGTETRLHDVNKVGAGTLTLNGANTFGDASDDFGLKGGLVNLGNAAALGNYEINFSTGSSSFDNTTGAAMTLANNNHAIVSSTNLTATFVGTNDLNMGTGGMAMNFNNGKFTLNVLASNLTFGGTISGNMDLVKNGAGTLTLNGANTFGSIGSSKGFTLSGGKVNLGNAAALGAGVITFNNLGVDTTIDNTSGASLTLANNNPITSFGNTLNFVGSDDLNLGTGNVTLVNNDSNFNVAAKTLTIGGNISGTRGMTKSGAGTLVLSGTNTFTGTTTVNAGTLRLSSAGALQESTLTSGGTGLVFDQSVGGHAFSIGGLSGNIALSLQDNAGSPNPVAVSVGGTTTDVSSTYDGSLGGPGSLTKTGAGTLTLTGSNTYAGVTNVSAGVLHVNGSHTGGGAYSVASGATLGGSGSIAASVAVSAGGVIAGGADGAGALTVASADVQGTLLVQYNGDNSTAGALMATGALDITNATLDFTNLGSATLSGASYVIATYGTLIGNGMDHAFSSVLNLPAGYSLNYHYSGDQIAIVSAAGLAGDFDTDGDVDGADFVAWQTHYPTTGGATLATGDANGDGDVNGADFAIWQANFPASPSPTAVVPEPSGILLTVFGLVGLCLFARRAF